MVAVVGMQGISGGGVYWTVTQAGNPDVLTMVFPERVATDATIPDVSLPEVVGQEAWTIDFDAVRAHLHQETAAHFPAWASGPRQRDAFRGGSVGELRHYAGDGRVETP